MKIFSFFTILLITIFSFYSFIYSHGFGYFVYVKSAQKGWNLAGQIKNKSRISSYDGINGKNIPSTVKAVGSAVTNCYFTISFPQRKNDIKCTPTQLFYLPEFDQWIPAFQLCIGDELLTASGEHILVSDIEFIREQIPVYSFEVEDTHTFFVGSQSVLVHNMVIPGFFIGISVSFGSGATAGGSAGSFFGPITLIGGIVIGGLIGVAAYALGWNQSFSYQVDYDPDAISCYLNGGQNDNFSYSNDDYPQGSFGSLFPEDPDDDNFFEQLKFRSTEKARTNKFGNMYKDPHTGLWWSVDKGRHGGSCFKVFKETARGFEHVHCADRFGRFILGKHKGPIGAFISFKDVIFRP